LYLALKFSLECNMQRGDRLVQRVLNGAGP
jgi:hypothetical protein